MSNEEFLFQGVSDNELIDTYTETQDRQYKNGIFSLSGKLASDTINTLYDEMRRRGLASFCAFYHIRRSCEEMGSEKVKEIITKIERETMDGDGIFSAWFTEDGDPIELQGSAISEITWLLAEISDAIEEGKGTKA